VDCFGIPFWSIFADSGRIKCKTGKSGRKSGLCLNAVFFNWHSGLFTYILITKQSISWAGVREAPAHVWLGGLLGAFYVTVIILAFPKLGPGLTFGLVVAGQMIISILLEHFNILVAQQNSISLMKLLGVLLVVAGVIIIRKF
jgi:transporter family-2 protein